MGNLEHSTLYRAASHKFPFGGRKGKLEDLGFVHDATGSRIEQTNCMLIKIFYRFDILLLKPREGSQVSSLSPGHFFDETKVIAIVSRMMIATCIKWSLPITHRQFRARETFLRSLFVHAI